MRIFRWCFSFCLITAFAIMVAWIALWVTRWSLGSPNEPAVDLALAVVLGIIGLVLWGKISSVWVRRALQAKKLDRRVYCVHAPVHAYVFPHPGSMVLMAGGFLGRRSVFVSQGYLRKLRHEELEQLWNHAVKSPSALHLTIVTWLAPFSNKLWKALPDVYGLTPWKALGLLLLSPAWRFLLWLGQSQIEVSYLWKSRSTRSLSVLPGWVLIQVR